MSEPRQRQALGQAATAAPRATVIAVCVCLQPGVCPRALRCFRLPPSRGCLVRSRLIVWPRGGWPRSPGPERGCPPPAPRPAPTSSRRSTEHRYSFSLSCTCRVRNRRPKYNNNPSCVLHSNAEIRTHQTCHLLMLTRVTESPIVEAPHERADHDAVARLALPAVAHAEDASVVGATGPF